MDWVWTWGGTFFGYRLGNSIFIASGVEIGRFKRVAGIREELYGRDGRYLGEIINRNRLITSRMKRAWSERPFTPTAGMAIPSQTDLAPLKLYPGVEDFPHPKSFEGSQDAD